MVLMPLLSKLITLLVVFFSSRRRHTRFDCDWSSDVCSSDLRHYCFVSHAPPIGPSPTRPRHILPYLGDYRAGNCAIAMSSSTVCAGVLLYGARQAQAKSNVNGTLDFAYASWRKGAQPLDKESAGDSGNGVEVHNAGAKKTILLIEVDLCIEAAHCCGDLCHGDLVSE